MHNWVKKEEHGTDVGGIGKGKDDAWHAELRAASARLSAAKALVQLSKSKAFHADL